MSTLLAPILQYFFTEHLTTHRQVSPRTIIAYRDSFRLFLQFLKNKTGKQPSALCVEDLDAPSVLDSWRVSKLNAPTKSVLAMPDLPRSALFSTLWPCVIRPVSVLSIASLPFRGNEQISDWWDISPARRSTLYWLRQISRRGSGGATMRYY